jgi:hypothetical protein
MGIGSYKEAERYRMRTNKNLTRTFYLDTRRTLDQEPFALEQVQNVPETDYNTEVDPGMVVPPQDVLPKNPIPNMPSAPGIPNPQFRQLELANGGRVELASGGITGDKEKLIKLIEDSNKGFKAESFKDLAAKAGYAPYRREASISLPVKLDTSKDKVTKAFEYLSSDLNKPVEEFMDLPKKISDLTGVKGTYISTLLQDNENFKELKPALTYLASPASRAKIMGTGRLFSDIVNRYEQAPGKQLAIGYLSPERKIMEYARRHVLSGGNKIKFTKPINEYGFGDAEFIYKGKTYDVDKLRYEGRKDKNFKELYKAYDEREKLLNKEVIHPITKEKVLFNELMQEAYEKGAGYKKTDIYDIDHIKGIAKEPFTNLRILTARTNQGAGALKSLEKQAEKGVLKNTAQYYSPENVSKQLNKIGYNYTKDIDKLAEDETKLAEDILLKERKLRTPQAIAKEKISITNLTDYLNNNPEEVKAFRAAGVVCRRSVGGKVDTECLAENIIKETEKLETGTDLQKASALNKFKNATKLGAGLAEEVIGFGKGVAGRTLGPLVALNSALEQFTSGNYREGVRKIADIADLTTLVGDPLGFEKMRTEGTIQDVRGKIGKENQASLDRILEFKDKYYQLQDINTKLERAQSSAEGQYDPESPGVDLNYLNELKKQQTDLNKIINSPKYQNIRTDYLNVGNAVKNEIFGRNINAPEQNKYTFETAAQEQLKSILGYDFYDELSDENKIIFKNLTASEKIKDQPVPFETPIQSPDDSMREGFAEGGGPKMGRRGFLGLLTGIAAAPEIMKSIKGTKAAKVASKIKLEKAEGMYPWFPDLIEKIKTKGKPFEEKEIIMEASYKHEPKGYGGLPKSVETVTRHVDGDTEFLLREYPDGRIAVDIHSPRNQEGSSTPVTLYYRPTMELKYYSGAKVEPAEFKVLEKEPRYFANGPDDVDVEMSEMRKIPGKNTIYGDVEAAERFATGKIQNRKIIPAKQARREQMEDAPTDFIEETSNYGPVYD